MSVFPFSLEEKFESSQKASIILEYNSYLVIDICIKTAKAMHDDKKLYKKGYSSINHQPKIWNYPDGRKIFQYRTNLFETKYINIKLGEYWRKQDKYYNSYINKTKTWLGFFKSLIPGTNEHKTRLKCAEAIFKAHRLVNKHLTSITLTKN